MLQWGGHKTPCMGARGDRRRWQRQAQAVSIGKGSGIRHPSPSSSVRNRSRRPREDASSGTAPEHVHSALAGGTDGSEQCRRPQPKSNSTRATQQLHERCDGEGGGCDEREGVMDD